jgi:hypothetical protein
MNTGERNANSPLDNEFNGMIELLNLILDIFFLFIRDHQKFFILPLEIYNKKYSINKKINLY